MTSLIGVKQGRVIMDGTKLSPGNNLVTFTDGSVGWVNIGADGVPRDERGMPVQSGGNTVTPQGGSVDGPKATNDVDVKPGPALPRGYVAVKPSDLPQDRLGPAGTQWTYAHNPTTGKVVRIAPDGTQYGMFSTMIPPGQKTPSNTPAPGSVTGAVRNAITRSVRNPQAGAAQANLNASVFGPNPFGFQYQPRKSTAGTRANPFAPTTGQAATPPNPTTPGAIDTPAGTVNTGGGAPAGTPVNPQETNTQTNGVPVNPLNTSPDATFDTAMTDVQNLRANVQAPRWNPFAANYWEQDPASREVTELGMQSKYGIPQASLQWEASRYRLPGVQRSNLSLGV